MSKATTSTAHRKLDVDAFEEGVYVEDDTTADNAGAVDQKATSVRSFMRGGQNDKALKSAIADPPYKAEKAVKDKNVKLVAEVLASFKSADIAGAVGALDENEKDTLLKFVYRAMEFPAETNTASLLAWHKAIVEAAGEGAIARVISDRKKI
eukprot:comp12771_c0_seq1/m.7899 comp12771_c0_seq1/g.7899  ORF comp12771_c0_seq1/g.7899 comp12771_c0_seq1/m.7899 type:complete len:152 (-) comp12771_c0_seq1:107-562(-)